MNEFDRIGPGTLEGSGLPKGRGRVPPPIQHNFARIRLGIRGTLGYPPINGSLEWFTASASQENRGEVREAWHSRGVPVSRRISWLKRDRDGRGGTSQKGDRYQTLVGSRAWARDQRSLHFSPFQNLISRKGSRGNCEGSWDSN